MVARDPPTHLDGIAVDLKTILTWIRAGKPRTEAEGRLAVLLGSDENLEHLWNNRFRVGSALVDLGFDGAVTPAFSTWWLESPYVGHLEVIRSAHVASALAHDLPIVPTIPWRTGRDLSAWVDWFSSSPPAMICIDTSTLRGIDEWKWALDGIACLRRLSRDRFDFQLWVHGPSTPRRLRDLFELEADAIVSSRHPYQLAKSNRPLSGLNDRVARSDVRASGRLEQNVLDFAEMVSLLRSTRSRGQVTGQR